MIKAFRKNECKGKQMRRIKNNIIEICGADLEVVFSMEEEFENGVFTIKLCGEIKNEVAYEFEDELLAVILACKKVELDFENVSYVASMALKTLLLAQQMIDERKNVSMTITGVSDNVLKEFRKAGFMNLLEFRLT